MSEEQETVVSKTQLLQEFVNAYEQLIETASLTAQHSHQEGTWGPREVIAHLTGWEVIGTSRVSQIAAGIPPFELDETPSLDDAINAAFVTLIGDQPLAALSNLLRQAYQRDVEILKQLDNALFHPGEYAYERTHSVIEHCQEHMQELTSNHP